MVNNSVYKIPFKECLCEIGEKVLDRYGFKYDYSSPINLFVQARET